MRDVYEGLGCHETPPRPPPSQSLSARSTDVQCEYVQRIVTFRAVVTCRLGGCSLQGPIALVGLE